MQVVEAKDKEQILLLAGRVFPGEQVRGVERLRGLTNFTYAVELSSGKYVFRLPGEGTEELINRRDEKISTELACSLGIDARLLFFDAESGVKISGYIPGAVTMSPETMGLRENIAAAAEALRRLHGSGADTGVAFEVFEMARAYEKIIRDNAGAFYDDYAGVRAEVMAVKEKTDRHRAAKVPCHNDPLCEN